MSKLKSILKFKKYANGWSFALIALVLIIGLPIYTLFFKLFEETTDSVWGHLVDTVLTDYIINSIGLVIVVSILTLLMGISSAWIVSTTNIPFRRQFEWMLILPLAIPTYIAAYTYAGIFDYTGPIQVFLRDIGFSDLVYIDIMNFWGVAVVMALVLFPYVYVVARSTFMSQSATLLEASRILGSSSWRTFFKIALPISRPAIIGGLSLVMMEVLNDYGAVKYYGISTFTTGIFRAWFSFGDPNSAINLSGILMGFIFIMIMAERLQRGKVKFDEGARIGRQLKRYQLTGWKKFFAWMVCFIPLFLGFIAPVFQLILWSFQTIKKIIDFDFLILMANSFGLALLAAVLCVGFSVIILFAVKVNKNRFFSLLAKFAALGYSIPGAVIAIGIMIPLLGLDKFLISTWQDSFNMKIGLIFSGTIFALTFAYVVRFLTVSLNPIEAAFKRTGDSIDEASYSLGAGSFKTLLKINLPLLKSALISGGILVFVDILKELPLTLILRPFNFHTLATKAYELASDEMIAESATPSLIIIVIGTIPIIILNRLMKNTKADGSIIN
ncbi:iron(III) ABC transporter permease [Marivirga tractuosa]|uniref:Binding-protein-dependent transport systems inner membrane component n=1 Tax=Marivirga tractuosa (strain ATCC 23168 / DSM 4126 / NBRC 15989 / NCIMB 1408 / VKM B-1430 / H-43) TaxID=643867 RepID=E4TQV3_MARTH|nr:iron ABC transporter permease [Marivirga tractuosa]ADR21653.1 binding-protein-dependent transport systems inner membrane component [Marivirga tractuosa DSM 4126]BDD13890.1 iron(III) ABC transporter permease [Marivirga tractuosa]